ncbi:MAG TPA: YoaK family protein [Xanthobacteraceae bacterium]
MASHIAAAPQALPKIVPVLLSFVAGYVDSCTFLALFGLYVAQVTGSFVLAGTETVVHDTGAVVKLLAIPLFCFAGVVTTLMVWRARRNDRSALPAALALEAALLIGLFASWYIGAPFSARTAPAVICASLCGIAAMGVQSAFVKLVVKGSPSTNVMTTNTTLFAVNATEFVMAWRARRRSPGDARLADEYAHVRDRFAMLWPLVLGFLAGTISGALAYGRVDMWCLLAAIAIVVALAAWGHWTATAAR